MRPGPGAIRLELGDPDIRTPGAVQEAMAKAACGPTLGYADPQGEVALREAIAASLDARFGRRFGLDETVVTHGATGALMATILAHIDPGDEVIIPEPSYSLYGDLVVLAGGRPRFIPQNGPDFRLPLDAISEAARTAKAIVICSPCNPTGTVCERGELEALAEIAGDNDLMVIVDEAYDRIVYEGRKFTSSLEIPELAERLVYIQSFSKAFAMTGWRVGYLIAPARLAAPAMRLHWAANGPLGTGVQRAAIAALSLGEEWFRPMLDEYAQRRQIVIDGFARKNIAIHQPEGAFYAFPRHPANVTSAEMTAIALEHGVSVRPGSEFGPSGQGYVRIAFSTGGEALRHGIDRLADAFSAAAARG